MPKDGYIYKVVFKFAPLQDKGNKHREFYFGSITAIYSLFGLSLIGVNAKALWAYKLTKGNTYYGRYCMITAERLIRNPQHEANKTEQA
jgi:hypothetical protein